MKKERRSFVSYALRLVGIILVLLALYRMIAGKGSWIDYVILLEAAVDLVVNGVFRVTENKITQNKKEYDRG